MRRILSTIEENTTISLQLNVDRAMRFYDFSYIDITTTQGERVVNELRKLYHVTIERQQDRLFTMHIESFDREHLCRSFSLSEKEYSSKLAQISDDIVLQVNNIGIIKAVVNIVEMQTKAEMITQKLSDSYVGNRVEEQFNNILQHYKQEQLVIQDAQHYIQYGLLCSNLYALYKPGKPIEKGMRYINIVANCVIDVEEQASVEKIDEDNGEVTIKVLGKLKQPILVKMIQYEMNMNDIDYINDVDKPILSKYLGLFTFNTKTGLLKAAQLDIDFSFGKNYNKTIQYKLLHNDSNN